jgi:phosphotriesterase-related protein
VYKRQPLNIIASTGYYVAGGLSLYFRLRGDGRLVAGPDPLEAMFVRDIVEGIAGTAVRAGMIKVKSARARMTDDEARVMTAAASAHQETGVPITTHSESGARNGIAQQSFLVGQGVSPTRIIIGHAGDTEDTTYLRTLMDAGSTIGMDRFGMAHAQADERRIDTVVELVRLGYADRMVLSHDAAISSHVTPPAWRAVHAPDWHREHLFRRILPALRERGVSEVDLERMLVENPRRLLTPGRA